MQGGENDIMKLKNLIAKLQNEIVNKYISNHSQIFSVDNIVIEFIMKIKKKEI